MTAVYRVAFESCSHIALILGEEYGDGSAWCQRCGSFQVYERCETCGALDCESKRDDGAGACAE